MIGTSGTATDLETPLAPTLSYEVPPALADQAPTQTGTTTAVHHGKALRVPTERPSPH
ncbi:hypothetical protein HAX54_003031, partial [Datura stramonium]|nr:hypothetical protein [Datura stramonium]